MSAASCQANSGVSTTCEMTGTRPSVVPSASIAVSSGTPAAIAEPKKNSRISAAAKTLMNSLEPCDSVKRTVSAPRPPCSICSSGPRAPNAFSCTRLKSGGLKAWNSSL